MKYKRGTSLLIVQLSQWFIKIEALKTKILEENIGEDLYSFE